MLVILQLRVFAHRSSNTFTIWSNTPGHDQQQWQHHLHFKLLWIIGLLYVYRDWNLGRSYIKQKPT